MTKWTFILFFALLGASCNSILNSKPSALLSEEEMTEVLVDIHLTEAALRVADDSLARLNDTTKLRILFAAVYKKHNIDPDDFNVSLDYYLQHIDELDKIYVEVINRLTELDATLQPKPVKVANSPTAARRQSLNKNVWYKAMNGITEPEEIFYFGPMQYPIEKKINVPEPLDYK
jgi:Domain of unknown function (DUF4296)